MVTKKTNKKHQKTSKEFYLHFSFIFLTIACCTVFGILTSITINDNGISINTELPSESSSEIPALIEGDQGEIIEIEGIPTYEEIDGGQFLDINEMENGEGEYQDLGWSETYNTSSPEAFKNATLNKCIYANNYYGAQCVSLARVFWWSYANRDVSTCGTGMAKGMMNCASQNAGNDFITYWNDAKYSIQAGDWLVFNGGQYGHVGMALGGYNNGYVALLGENQGGNYCERGGSATNIININLKNLIGFYRPKNYVKSDPVPDQDTKPVPHIVENSYTVKKGDTLGQILRNQGYTGTHLYGNEGICERIARDNQIKNRNLIFPGQKILIDKQLFTKY